MTTIPKTALGIFAKNLRSDFDNKIKSIPTIKGEDGIGINIKSWTPAIYREGAYVQHNFGQVFKALIDTNLEPSKSSDWERVGTGGFKFMGGYNSNIIYEHGDLVVKDFGLFLHDGNDLHLVAGRGSTGLKGDKGLSGNDGRDGVDGKDGDEFETVDYANDTIVITTKNNKVFSVDLEPLKQDTTKSVTSALKQFASSIPDLVKSYVEKALTPPTDNHIPLRFFRGEWDANLSYQRGDLVTYSRGMAVALRDHKGVTPFFNVFDDGAARANWQMLAPPTFGWGSQSSVINDPVVYDPEMFVTLDVNGYFTIDSPDRGIIHVDTYQGQAQQDLIGIRGGTIGQRIIVKIFDNTHDVMVKDNTGTPVEDSIRTTGDRLLNHQEDIVSFIYASRGNSSPCWFQVSASDNSGAVTFNAKPL
jgi:hypothetical protein